ncbi:MAG: VTT domain-containing protein [Arenicella sp.]|nr:VTT domain-containing protein [Arenicella sp.]
MTVTQNRRKPLIIAISGIVFLVLALYIRNYVSLEQLAIQEERFRSLIALNPTRSFLLGFGIYIVLSLVPGTGGKGVVYGWLFGFWQAVTIVTIGLTVTGMIIFSLSRYLFRESIERRYPRFVALMNKHIKKEGAFYLLTLRMAHAPFSIVNPISGASRVSAWTFFWTTLVGLIPANAIWVYVGIRLPSLREFADSGAGAFIDPPLIAALVACGLLPLLVRLLVRRFGIPRSTSGTQTVNQDRFQLDKS